MTIPVHLLISRSIKICTKNVIYLTPVNQLLVLTRSFLLHHIYAKSIASSASESIWLVKNMAKLWTKYGACYETRRTKSEEEKRESCLICLSLARQQLFKLKQNSSSTRSSCSKAKLNKKSLSSL